MHFVEETIERNPWSAVDTVWEKLCAMADGKPCRHEIEIEVADFVAMLHHHGYGHTYRDINGYIAISMLIKAVQVSGAEAVALTFSVKSPVTLG